jgi:hypothetical protein
LHRANAPERCKLLQAACGSHRGKIQLLRARFPHDTTRRRRAKSRQDALLAVPPIARTVKLLRPLREVAHFGVRSIKLRGDSSPALPITGDHFLEQAKLALFPERS